MRLFNNSDRSLRRLTVVLLLFAAGIVSLSSQTKELINPFDFPPLLSGNFGELRSNHFHSGIDFKTQGVEGKAVHCVEEGYVSRISVSRGGYGNALYVTHPNGITTVYGHLQRFAPPIAAYLKTKQYEQESFAVNLTLTPEQFPVKRGEVIALSGNTGSSGGPHLHLDVRDTNTEEVIDPLPYYRSQLNDTRPPRVQGVMVYPLPGEGVVDGKSRKQKIIPKSDKASGITRLSTPIEAWGKIGLAIQANDYMDQTANIYGVKELTLTVDGEILFHSDIDRFAIDESRYLNSYIDYEEYISNRAFFVKSFVEPGNKLRFIQNRNRGILFVNEERPYDVVYTLRDGFGNTTELKIPIIGRKQDILPIDTANRVPFYRIGPNRFGAKGVRLTIPHGNLYDDLLFQYNVVEDSTALAATHRIHNAPVPLHRNAQLSIRLQKDTLANKKQYGVVRLNKKGRSWIGGTWRDGWIDVNIRELGHQYTLAQDRTPPVITPLNAESWTKDRRLQFRLTDNLSGVATYRGEIDGQYALFEINNRSVITYHFDRERLQPGKHHLLLKVTDACGNETILEQDFLIR